ncbi:MAG TPA: MerR family transcriptional regulator [Clostridia bacterium]|nr:MerR family transcriptional regulator [Clostridia bacterium]
MRISELARSAGLSVATVKYYIREGLLPAGVRSAPNQAEYGDEHLRRLRLIRTLRTVAGLDIGRIRRVVAAIEDDSLSRHAVFGVVEQVQAREPSAEADADARANEEVDGFIEELGWHVRPDAAARKELADILTALRGLGRQYGTEVFRPYAAAADRMASWEVAQIPPSEPRSVAVERMVVGTVVFGAVFDALRRLAHEHHSGATERDGPGKARSANR